MPIRQSNRLMEGLIPGYGKIRKRGCSSSSSSSSKVHNYRFKRAILVGKNRVGGGSRSSTPAPSWRMTPSAKSKLGGGGRGVESPKHDGGGGGGRSRPVSARKLAATLWEMNEMPSPSPENSEMTMRRREKETKMRVKERTNRPVHTPGSLPPHLSDPSHTPVSERMDRSVTGCRHRRPSSISQKLKLEDNNGEVFDSPENTTLMEIETRSRAQNNGSPRLKDISNALTTSKELLKIIHRMWAHDNLPSSTMSLVSALHTELERARLQVNHLVKDKRSNQSEINYLLKCFCDEKASWKVKERTLVEELEIERKLRRRFESLNKKIGRELAEIKKELESERRKREIMEQVCDELAVDSDELAEEIKRESVKVHEEVEREREMLQLADKLREERVQMKLAEAKHQFEEKNAVVDQLKSQLEAFLGKKKGQNRRDSILTHEDEEREDEDSVDSDLHSIEINMDNNNKSFKWAHAYNSKQDPIEKRNSNNRKSTSSIQKGVSDEWGILENFLEFEKQTPRRSYGDEMQRYKSVKGLRDRILTNSRSTMAVQERPHTVHVHGSGSKPKTAEARGETFSGRRSKK